MWFPSLVVDVIYLPLLRLVAFLNLIFQVNIALFDFLTLRAIVVILIKFISQSNVNPPLSESLNAIFAPRLFFIPRAACVSHEFAIFLPDIVSRLLISFLLLFIAPLILFAFVTPTLFVYAHR